MLDLTKKILILLVVIGLVACGGSDSDDTITTLGNVIDGPLENAKVYTLI
ncbi:MAG: hypothetical protein Rsou_1339 [Candidatus Ruthia sp. Asou_11_S2]|nr:hypothetical protein [Candidatus Ruthia sp. Asou_11_S2]